MSCFDLHPVCPGSEDCTACQSYAKHVVEPFAHDARSLPSPLAERLRAIGRPPTSGTHDDDSATEALEAVAAAARRPRAMPVDLRRRLRAIPTTARATARREPPRWLADGGWGLAACALLTAGLTMATGDVSARFQSTTDAVERRVDEMVASRGKTTTWLDRLDDSIVSPLGALTKAGLEQVHKGRVATVDWLDHQVDQVVDDARSTGLTTWTWLRDSTTDAADYVGRRADELAAAVQRARASEPESSTSDTNDPDTVPAAVPNAEGSLP